MDISSKKYSHYIQSISKMSNIITTLFGKNEAYFSSLRCGLIKAMYRVGVLIEVAFHLYAMIRECRKAVFILGWIPPFDIFDHTALLIYCLACVTLHGTWAGLVMGAHLNIVPPSATVLANDADRHYHALLCVAHFIGAGFYLSKAVWNHWRGKYRYLISLNRQIVKMLHVSVQPYYIWQ